jgi:hypothetical protein
MTVVSDTQPSKLQGGSRWFKVAESMLLQTEKFQRVVHHRKAAEKV